MIIAFAAAQAVMSVPVTSAPALPPVTSGYSIVVARAVSQADPIPIACGSDFCTSWFLGRFDKVENIAGRPLPEKFDARIEMGSPFNMQYRLALIVETLANGTLRVRADRGEHYQTKLACFDLAHTQALTPQPSGDRIVQSGKQLCVK